MTRHVLLFEPRFVDPIVARRKCHTIRPPRKRIIRPGDQLLLRQWQGKAYRSRQVQFAAVTVAAVRDFYFGPLGIVLDGRLLTPEENIELAAADGFASPFEMYCWHSDHYDPQSEKQLIAWTP